MDLDIPSDVDASLTPYEKVRWAIPDVCQSPKSNVCIIPDTDTPQWDGAHAADPLGGWTHEIDGQADFEQRVVREATHSVAFLDGCYSRAESLGVENQLVNCEEFTGYLTGWNPSLDDTNTTDSVDYIGYTEDCVNEYRDLGVPPCTGSIVQPMEMLCNATLGIWEPYDSRIIYVRIDVSAADTVGSKKGGSGWQDFGW
jgi:hypothetical protein